LIKIFSTSIWYLFYFSDTINGTFLFLYMTIVNFTKRTILLKYLKNIKNLDKLENNFVGH